VPDPNFVWMRQEATVVHWHSHTSPPYYSLLRELRHFLL